MKKIVLFFFILASLFPSGQIYAASSLSSRLLGRILLQVESKGEAWYVSPSDSKRYFLGRPNDAFNLMRSLGIGITNSDLSKIPVGIAPSSGSPDTDKDGLPDDLEVSLGTDPTKADTDGDSYSDKVEVLGGYNPKGVGKINIDNSLVSKNKGKIFLQVQGAGEAWYVDPVGLKRYFLGRPADAFAVMRSLGLGITDLDLASIAIGSLSGASPEKDVPSSDNGLPFDTLVIEQKIHVLVNQQRTLAGLPALKWNDEVAAVAREHSQDQANEDEKLTDLNRICNYAVIHHEGLVFGLMPADRLNSRGVNYYSKAGENIALVGAAEVNYLVNMSTFDEKVYDTCQAQVEEWNASLKEDMENITSESEKISRLNQDLAARRTALLNAETFQISRIDWQTADSIAQSSLTGWMNSPGHRANILDPDYDEAGIGVAYVNGYIIATQVFIKRASCGYEGGPCCDRHACYLPTICQADEVCR